MDSLLATYASSDDEDDNRRQPPLQPPSFKPTPSLFSSLPPPKPSSLFSLLPPPISQTIPLSSPYPVPNPNPNPNPKKVVQFHPPKPPTLPNNNEDDDDEDVEEREAKKRRQLAHQNTSIKSFLSTIPAPKNSISSSLGSASGSRRSIIDTELPAPSPTVPIVDQNVEVGQVILDNGSHVYDHYDGNVNYGNYEGYVAANESYGQQYYEGSNNWNSYNNSGGAAGGGGGNDSVVASGIDSFVGKNSGKRRKDQVPVQIMEVKQDELMKNRPTEDKSKLTGLAFGPSYQPASSKGKPAKLHKRKHQIGSLYYDMQQKEREFAERRAKGFLTKSETQAKYGW